MKKPKSYSGTLPYCFISYSHRNDSKVYSLIRSLQNELNVRLWFDEGIHSGDVWDEIIAEHIRDSSFFVAVISPEYIDSVICMRELRYALNDLHQQYIVLYLSETKLSPGMEMNISSRQNIFLYKQDLQTTLFQLSQSTLIKNCSFSRADIEIPQNAKYYIDPEISEVSKSYFNGDVSAISSYILNITDGSLSDDIAPEELTAKLYYIRAYCLEKGIIYEKDSDKALKYYEIAAKYGSAAASCRLGVYYYESSVEKEKDLIKKAEYYLKNAADKGYTAAEYYLGIIYIELISKIDAGIELIERTASNGFLPAINYSGILYGCGIYKKIPLDYQKALELYRSCADSLVAAQYNYAVMCFCSEGMTSPNYKNAAAYFKKAATSGDPDALYSLGVCYNNGLGVTMNKIQAKAFFSDAAKNGSSEAIFDMCKTLIRENEYFSAWKWLNNCHEENFSPVCWAIGVCSQYGLGCDTDKKKAIEYYGIAAGQHYPPAIRALNWINTNNYDEISDDIVPYYSVQKKEYKDPLDELQGMDDLLLIASKIQKTAQEKNKEFYICMGRIALYGWGMICDYLLAFRYYTLANDEGYKIDDAEKKKLLINFPSAKQLGMM